MDTRIAAYAVIADERGVLLAHWNEAGHSGWTLPGGGIEWGEDPAAGAVREIFEETGYDAVVDDLIGIDSIEVAATDRLGSEQVPLHSLRIVYRAHVIGGRLRNEVDGTTDEARWWSLDEAAQLPRVSIVDIGLAFAGLR